jgi:hypothetical protein
MTGVGDLFSNLQPVTENRSTLSLSAGRCGAAAPQKGSVETGGLGRRGRLSPSWNGPARQCRENQLIMLKENLRGCIMHGSKFW